MPALPSIFTNTDGSKTLLREDIDETYHSRHGAIAESLHVFIKEGLNFFQAQNQGKNLHILEIGFGTGLNAMLSYLECNKIALNIQYHSLETFPLPYSLVQNLQYNEHWGQEEEKKFTLMHDSNWEENILISECFSLKKIKQSLLDFETNEQYDIVFFDAFGPDKQAELWQLELFQKLFAMMSEGGVFVTYSSKGDVRRALQTAGFKVEKIAGPPRKRHMLRAIKTA